jgi:hypothetical protein
MRQSLAPFTTACAIAGFVGVAQAQYPFQTGRPGTEYAPGHQASSNIKVFSAGD